LVQVLEPVESVEEDCKLAPKRWKDGILQSGAVPGNEARVRLQLLDETVPTDESPDSSSSACASRAHQRRRTVFSETVPRTKIDVSGEVSRSVTSSWCRFWSPWSQSRRTAN
jgi:hypothetical protein